MSSPDLWQRIRELYERDIYVGLRVDGAGLHAWMTDRHFVRRAERDIEKGPWLMMAQDLQRWLEAEAPKMRGGNGVIDHANNTSGSSLQSSEVGTKPGPKGLFSPLTRMRHRPHDLPGRLVLPRDLPK